MLKTRPVIPAVHVRMVTLNTTQIGIIFIRNTWLQKYPDRLFQMISFREWHIFGVELAKYVLIFKCKWWDCVFEISVYLLVRYFGEKRSVFITHSKPLLSHILQFFVGEQCFSSLRSIQLFETSLLQVINLDLEKSGSCFQLNQVVKQVFTRTKNTKILLFWDLNPLSTYYVHWNSKHMPQKNWVEKPANFIPIDGFWPLVVQIPKWLSNLDP